MKFKKKKKEEKVQNTKHLSIHKEKNAQKNEKNI